VVIAGIIRYWKAFCSVAPVNMFVPSVFYFGFCDCEKSEKSDGISIYQPLDINNIDNQLDATITVYE
jgi:hypothetical protein